VQGASQGLVGRVEPDSPAGLFLVSEDGARGDGSSARKKTQLES